MVLIFQNALSCSVLNRAPKVTYTAKMDAKCANAQRKSHVHPLSAQCSVKGALSTLLINGDAGNASASAQN